MHPFFLIHIINKRLIYREIFLTNINLTCTATTDKTAIDIRLNLIE